MAYNVYGPSVLNWAYIDISSVTWIEISDGWTQNEKISVYLCVNLNPKNADNLGFRSYLKRTANCVYHWL
jgi:hypothetical protein